MLANSNELRKTQAGRLSDPGLVFFLNSANKQLNLVIYSISTSEWVSEWVEFNAPPDTQ